MVNVVSHSTCCAGVTGQASRACDWSPIACSSLVAAWVSTSERILRMLDLDLPKVSTSSDEAWCT